MPANIDQRARAIETPVIRMFNQKAICRGTWGVYQTTSKSFSSVIFMTPATMQLLEDGAAGPGHDLVGTR